MYSLLVLEAKKSKLKELMVFGKGLPSVSSHNGKWKGREGEVRGPNSPFHNEPTHDNKSILTVRVDPQSLMTS